MTEDSGATAGGFIQMLPVHLTEGMTCTAIQAAVLPWGSPSHMAVVGHSVTDNSVQMIAIGYEWPTAWLRTTEPISAFDLEWLHVQRFRSDHVLGLGAHPFWNVQQGGDPPDVIVETQDGVLGIECTRFAIPMRQRAHGLFRAIRQRIGMTGPEHFAAVAGQVVYMWFNDDDASQGLPFARPETEAAQTLVESLAEYRPTPEQLWIASGNLPDRAPELPLIRTGHGAAFYCIPMMNSVPDTMLFSYAGFEVGLAYTTSHQSATEWESLWQRVIQKDKPGNDWLLISVGAPDNRGTTFPSEEALADFLLNNPAPLASPVNLRRVTMHFWSSGRAVDLWPERRDVFGPLYQGISLAHRPLIPPAARP